MGLNHIRNLLHQVEHMRKVYEEMDALSGDQFNIFRIIRLTTDEVRIHSAFLAELLNPNGSHGQGTIFLRLFLQQIKCDFFDSETASIAVEAHIGFKNEDSTCGGRVDILLTDKKHNAIVIENKIDAPDQEKQLVRYYNHCVNKKYKNFKLIYLTRDGRVADKDSTDDKKGSLFMKDGDHYHPLSYNKDIVNWLVACRKESALNPLIREGISHYINLIKYLTNQLTNSKMETEIINLLSLSPENLKAAITIENTLKKAKTNVQRLFWEKLTGKLEERGLKLVPGKEETIDSAVNNYYTSSRKTYPYLAIEIHRIGKMAINWFAEIDDRFYVGFYITKNEKETDHNIAAFKKYREITKQVDSRFDLTSMYTLGWKLSDPELNFRTFSTDSVCDLVKPQWLEKVTSDIANDAIRDIEKMKNLLQTLA